jgi:hypothetical protein
MTFLQVVKQILVDAANPAWIDECSVDAFWASSWQTRSPFWKKLPRAMIATPLPR